MVRCEEPRWPPATHLFSFARVIGSGMTADYQRGPDDLVNNILLGDSGCVGDAHQHDRELMVALGVDGGSASGNCGDVGDEFGAEIGERKPEPVAVLSTHLAGPSLVMLPIFTLGR